MLYCILLLDDRGAVESLSLT